MRTFTPSSEAERATLRRVAARLKRANALSSAAEKVAKKQKELLATWLKDCRLVDIEKLAIGELVCIEDVLLLEIGKQNKFDPKAFESAHPQTFAKFKRDFPIQKFKPLV